MTDLSYAALTDDQLQRVRYLFADHALGTDPSAYVYELRQGEIAGRRPLTACPPSRPGKRPAPQLRLEVLPEPNITPEMSQAASAALDRLAEIIVRKTLSIQVEVNAS